MSATPAQPAVTTPAPKPYVRPKRPRVDWKAVWPIPLAIVSAAALAFALFTAVARAPKDDPGVPIAQAKAAYAADKFPETLDLINKELIPYINEGKLSAEQEIDFFQLRARALYYGQERMGIQQEENYKAIADAYEQGRRRGMPMEPADTGNLAEAYLRTGRVDKAIELARQLEHRDEARQLRLYERIATQLLKEGSTQYPLVTGILNQMLQMPRLTVNQRAWVVARQAQIHLDAGFPQEAITRLLRELPKFESLPQEIRADLLFILGKAYADGVDDQQALVYLDQALRAFSNKPASTDPDEEFVLDTYDARAGEALVIQGRILAQNSAIEKARERFSLVRENFKESPVYALAVMGEADTAAELGDLATALDLYSEAAQLIIAGQAKPIPGITPVTLGMVGARLMDQHNRRILQNDPQEALKFVRKAQEVYAKRPEGVPPEVLIAMAQASRLNAQLILRDASGTPANQPAPHPDDVSPVSAAQAKGYLLDAAQNFRDHAKAVAATQFNASMQSWLAAGDCYDQAGDFDPAIDAYSMFLTGADDEYTDKPKAMFRIAQVYQAKGSYATAAGWYEKLVNAREGFAGQWADRSLVPLARCYVLDPSLARTDGDAKTPAPGDDKPNELRAIALLNRAISGRVGIGPDAWQMRDAQAELGELYYRRAEYRQAIEVFNRLVNTYNDQTPRLPTVLFKRADAHRQLARQIIDTFDSRPLSEKQELQEAMRTHLRDARAGYTDAAAAIARKGNRATRVEKLYQRNAMFYTADCAFLLGEYEQAVQEYARAREQYAADPAALVAMVQTVTAFVRLERWDDAQIASERAKNLLATIPEETWSSPELLLPMERRHWESWLAAKIQLESRSGARANVPTQ